MLQKSILGFHLLAKAAGTHEVFEIVDALVISAAKISGLLKNLDESQETMNRPSRFSVEFGRNRRAHVSVGLMFKIVHEYGNSIHKGWEHVRNTIIITLVTNIQILECFKSFFAHGLLPDKIVQVEGLQTLQIRRLPLIVAEDRAASKERSSGLFSTISHLLSMAASATDDYPPSSDELEAIDISKKCGEKFFIPFFFEDSK
jgi:hypothetical protein